MKIALQLLIFIASFNSFSQDIATQNGETKATKEETKEYIVRVISEYGFQKKNILNRKYKASFEGDNLRLIFLRKNGDEADDGGLYDFSNVYKFGRVDKRSNSEAYLNIYVATSVNKTNIKWFKHKLVLQIKDSQSAETLLNALKHFNSLLVAEKKDPRF